MTMTSSEYIEQTSKEYALYVAQNRAIPKVTDGLKDGQRKFLWIMRNKADKIKTVSLAGLSISENLFLHGDSSASDTISMLAAPFCNNIPYLSGVGNFGTRVGPTDWSQPRYTYVKKYKATEELMYKDLNIVPLQENYDGSNVEPINFLPLIPLVLLNGVSGIAVGWSTDILPRNITNIIDNTIKVLKGKKIERLKPSYDYLGCDVAHIENNSWYIYGEASAINTTTVKITGLPPDLSLEKFKEKLNKMEDDGLIQTYTDNSAEFINIEVKLKREVLSKLTTKEKLLDFFKLKQKKTERIVVLDFNNKSIKQYEDDISLVKDFVKWRLGWYTVRYNKMLEDDTSSLNFWNAIIECFNKKLPSKLSTKNSKKEIEEEVKTICKKIPLTPEQIDRISSLPSYRWAKDHYQQVKDNIDKLNKNISFYKDILADDKKLKDVYISELEALKKAI